LSDIDKLVKSLPPETRKIFISIWETLTPNDRKSLASLLNGVPSNSNLLRTLIKLSSDELKQAFGQKRRVAIVGPANVGKSTLFNQLIQKKNDTAAVSPLPGTTRRNQLADSGLFMVVDTPGADAVGVVGEIEREEALRASRDADILIIVYDAIQGIKQTELDLHLQLKSLNKPYLVVMNKVDLARKDAPRIIEKAAEHLGLKPEQIIPIVAKTGENLDEIILEIAAIEPEIIAALGAALPEYRWKLAWKVISGAASAAAVIALTPLPVLDFGPLIVTQSIMVLGIARIYNYKINLSRAREIAATFGLGFLGRSIFMELSKLGGVPGWVLAAAVASSTTVVMGYASSLWFESSKKLTPETLKKMTETMTAYLVERLHDIAKGKPTSQTLKQRVEQALEESAFINQPKQTREQPEVKLE